MKFIRSFEPGDGSCYRLDIFSTMQGRVPANVDG